MTEPSLTAAIREIPIEIYDLAETPIAGLGEGFYFNIPLSDDDKVHPGEVALDGPYPTREEAFEAARSFITECLTDGEI